MRHRPLNSDAPFALWPHFNPGGWIDFNPSFVRIAPNRAYAVIRRDRVPPVPGKGTVWAVRVDDTLQPAGTPFPLVADGEDPRAVAIGNRVLVFYVLFEREPQADGSANPLGRITGTSMVLAEFDTGSDGNEPWTATAHFKLPKYPLGNVAAAPAGSNPGWEKNWVPFVTSSTPGAEQVGLLYAHDPWQVLLLDVPSGIPERRFAQAFKADGLRWSYGGIRGGTPPVPYRKNGQKGEAGKGSEEGEEAGGSLITFFHSSEVVGSRKSYMAGACVFEDRPPYKPLAITTEPLLVAPYKGGMHRHGWPVAASVIFPLGCERTAAGDYRLLCGIDDGEIGSFVVPQAALQERLQPWPVAAVAAGSADAAAAPTARTATLLLADGRTLPLAADAPLLLLQPGAAAQPQTLLRFLALCAGRGRTLLDVGSDAGLFATGLFAGYANTEAVATTATAARWRLRNAALNGCARLTVHLTADVHGMPGSRAELADAAAAVARPPCTLATLDELGLANLDLVTIDSAGSPLPLPALLQGLQHTLSRDRPLLLLQGATDGSDRAATTAVLAALGYGVEAIFPRTPHAVLATHPSRRHEIAWFV